MAPVKGMGCVFAENAFKRDRQKGSMDLFGRIEQSPGTPARRSSVAFWQRSAAGRPETALRHGPADGAPRRASKGAGPHAARRRSGSTPKPTEISESS